MKVSAIIPAAGSGKRFGGKKQFKLLNGQSLLLHTIKPFLISDLISELVIVISETDKDKFQKELDSLKCSKPIFLVPGGLRRQDSVKNGIMASNNSTDIVCIHDAARPFVTEALIKTAIKACITADGSVVALKSVDTVKYSKNGEINHTLDRKNIWLAQTPQVFWKDKLINAIKKTELERINVTDEALIMEKAGYKIVLVQGIRKNFKITTEYDWELAKSIMR